MLKKCPGIDKLRADARDKLKTYLQEIVNNNTKVNVNDSFFIFLVIKSTFE